jgi:hypothetical protein
MLSPEVMVPKLQSILDRCKLYRYCAFITGWGHGIVRVLGPSTLVIGGAPNPSWKRRLRRQSRRGASSTFLGTNDVYRVEKSEEQTKLPVRLAGVAAEDLHKNLRTLATLCPSLCECLRIAPWDVCPYRFHPLNDTCPTAPDPARVDHAQFSLAAALGWWLAKTNAGSGVMPARGRTQSPKPNILNVV